MIRIDTDSELHRQLTQPSARDIAFARKLRGDVTVLGAGGKMGPTLALRLLYALREAGRNTQGVKLINLNANDKLTAIARVVSEKGEEEASGPEGPELAG